MISTTPARPPITPALRDSLRRIARAFDTIARSLQEGEARELAVTCLAAVQDLRLALGDPILDTYPAFTPEECA